jgi:uncharacterized membrane protein YsdA (DUF1294 family)/cold shock CspA family protein
MSGAKSPRYQGKISSWKDDQGFGFITPNGGGPAIFVHIKSFSSHGKRPQGDELVSYNLTMNDKGLPRAENVAYVRARNSRPSAGGTGAIPLLTATTFLVFVATSVLIGKVPSLVFGLYLGMSVVAHIAYFLDKSAARNNRWRTRESTLHLLGVLGGWPGAIFAQQFYRHKSQKQSFQTMFRLTVIANCAALGWLVSPIGSDLLRTLIGSP